MALPKTLNTREVEKFKELTGGEVSVRVSTESADPLDITFPGGVEVTQATHDNLNGNANIQVGDTDVSNGNPVPVSDAGGSLTVDAASLPLPTGAATAANQLPDGHNVTVDNTAGNPVPVSLTPAAVSPTIYNVSVVAASTEYSQALSANTQKFSIQNRDKGRLQLAFTTGQTNTTYISIPAGATYSEDSINSTVTLYFESNKASQTVEIVEWA